VRLVGGNCGVRPAPRSLMCRVLRRWQYHQRYGCGRLDGLALRQVIEQAFGFLPNDFVAIATERFEHRAVEYLDQAARIGNRALSLQFQCGLGDALAMNAEQLPMNSWAMVKRLRDRRSMDSKSHRQSCWSIE
jgi:hypothetical protein